MKYLNLIDQLYALQKHKENPEVKILINKDLPSPFDVYSIKEIIYEEGIVRIII